MVHNDQRRYLALVTNSKNRLINLVVIVLALCSSSVFGQFVNKDSLIKEWKDSNNPDTTRLAAYSTYLRSAVRDVRTSSGRDSLLVEARNLLDEAVVAGERKYQGLAYMISGFVLSDKSAYKDASANYYRALGIFDELNDIENAVTVHWSLGALYRAVDQYDLSLSHYSEALDYLATNDSDSVRLRRSGILNNIGDLYRQTGRYNKAVDIFEQSLDHMHEIGGYNLPASRNLAMAYIELGELQSALEIADNMVRDTQRIADGAIGWGNQEYAVKLAEGLYGDIYLASKNYSKARSYLIPLVEDGEVWRKKDLARSYLGESNPRKAIELMEPYYYDISNTIYNNDRAEASKLLYDAFKMMEEPSKAIEYLEIYMHIKDSLDKKEIDKQRALALARGELEIEMKLDSIKNVQEVLTLQNTYGNRLAAKDRFRNLVLLISTLLTFLAIGLYYRFRSSRRNQRLIQIERDMDLEVIKKTLPGQVAAELRATGRVEAREYDLATILFTDFVGFTRLTESSVANDLIDQLNYYFGEFDIICEKYGIEKIKTIGDAYMAVGGLPVPSQDSVKSTVLAALEMVELVGNPQPPQAGGRLAGFEMRVGVHSGSVIAGVVGRTRYQYDIWGDAVNTASRIEEAGESGKVNISKSTYDLVKHSSLFQFEKRDSVSVKGKGDINMWFVSKAK